MFEIDEQHKSRLKKTSLVIAFLLLIFILTYDASKQIHAIGLTNYIFFLILGDALCPLIIVIATYFGKTENKKWRYGLTAYTVIYFITSILSTIFVSGEYYVTTDLFGFIDVYADLIIYFFVNLFLIHKKYIKIANIFCLIDYLFGFLMFSYSARIGDVTTALELFVYHMVWPVMIVLALPDKGYASILISKSVIGKSTRRLSALIVISSFIIAIIQFILYFEGYFGNIFLKDNFPIITFTAFLAIVWIFLIYYNRHINEEDIKKKEMLEEANKNNKTLLAEVHHRVKNNLGVLSSFTNLEKRKIEDERSLEVLNDIQNRIKTMSLVHENLYETLNFGEINAYVYIAELSSNIRGTVKQNKITFDLDIDKNINLNIDTVTPIGLIMTETITNSFKYAFPNQEGIISIKLDEKDSNYILTIADNGVGFSRDSKNTGMGTIIIETLVDQIDGEMILESDNGVKRTIIFPKK